jgi:hypothetical protein
MTHDILDEKCACGKTWRDYHVLLSVIGDKVNINCYPQPTNLQTEENRTYLRYVLNAHAAKEKALSELKAVKKKNELDKQSAAAELKRTLEASHSADIKTLEAEHTKAIAAGELTRVQLVTSHDAKVADLEARLKEANGETEALRKECAAKLAASEKKAAELQLQIDGLNAELIEVRTRHRGLKEKSLDIVRMLISVGTRVVVLEQQNGVVPKVDPKHVFKAVLGIDFDDDDDEVVPVSELGNDPTPIPLTVRKTADGNPATPANGTPTAAPKATAAPPPAPAAQPRLMVLDGSDPDDQEDDDHEVSDDHVISTSSADGEEPDEDAEECDACAKKAKYAMSFMGKDGKAVRFVSCEPTAHDQVFFDNMKKLAKAAPPAVSDVKLYFQQINP